MNTSRRSAVITWHDKEKAKKQVSHRNTTREGRPRTTNQLFGGRNLQLVGGVGRKAKLQFFFVHMIERLHLRLLCSNKTYVAIKSRDLVDL